MISLTKSQISTCYMWSGLNPVSAVLKDTEVLTCTWLPKTYVTFIMPVTTIDIIHTCAHLTFTITLRTLRLREAQYFS